MPKKLQKSQYLQICYEPASHEGCRRTFFRLLRQSHMARQELVSSTQRARVEHRRDQLYSTRDAPT